MKDFLLFRKMLAPILIQCIFWLVIMFLIFVAIFDLMHHTSYRILFEIIILGPLITRIICEVLILFFQMNDNLIEIRRHLKHNLDS